MKTFNTKNIVFGTTIIISIIIMLFICYYKLDIMNSVYNTRFSDDTFSDISKNLSNIKQGDTISQKFIAKSNNLSKLFIKMKGKANTNLNLKLTLTNITQNEIISSEEIICDNIRESSEYIFDFKNQKQSKGQEYELKIEVLNLEKSNDLTIKHSTKKLSKNVTMYVNGEEIQGTLGVNECYTSNKKLMAFIAFSVAITAIFVILSIIVYRKKEFNVEKTFLLTVPILCILYIVIMPLFTSHDEIRHWKRAYEITEGKFLTEVHGDIIGSELPKNVEWITDGEIRQIDYKMILERSNTQIDKEEKEVINMVNTATYSPIQYIPNSLGIVFAKVFTNNVTIMAYMSRIFNALISCTIIYFAIKLIPFGKKFLLLPLLTPIAIEVLSSITSDGITISTAFLLIAYILHLKFTKTALITKKDIAIIATLSIIISLCKIVYIPLVFLVLLLPKEKFKTRKQQLLICGIIIILSIVINLSWFVIANQYLTESSQASSINLRYILNNPIEYIQKVLYTVSTTFSTYTSALFGGSVGHAVISLGQLSLYTFMFFTIVLVASTGNDIKDKFSNLDKIIIIGIVIIIIGLIFTALYMQYNPIGNAKIIGVQGRYFTPFLPLIYLMIAGTTKIKSDYNENNINKTIAIITYIQYIYIFLIIFMNFI